MHCGWRQKHRSPFTRFKDPTFAIEKPDPESTQSPTLASGGPTFEDRIGQGPRPAPHFTQ
eukprot:11106098-Alexandrium_andersonii.AAC.1